LGQTRKEQYFVAMETTWYQHLSLTKD